MLEVTNDCKLNRTYVTKFTKKWGVDRTNRIKNLVGMHDGRFMFDYKI